MAKSTRTPSSSTTSKITAPPSRVTTARPASILHTVPNTLWISQELTTLEGSRRSSLSARELPSPNGEHTQVVKDSARPNRQNLRHLWKTPSVPHVPASPCRNTGCPELRPCPLHPDPKPWANSKARRRANGATLTTTEEARRRTRILRRHRGICHVCSLPYADQVDHVIPLAEGGADTDDNLRPIHAEPCHRVKTAAERRRAIDRRRGRPSS